MSCADRGLGGRKRMSRSSQIVAMSSVGKTDAEMAEILQISIETVSTHWARLMAKLGSKTRAEALAILLTAEINYMKEVLDADE